MRVPGREVSPRARLERDDEHHRFLSSHVASRHQRARDVAGARREGLASAEITETAATCDAQTVRGRLRVPYAEQVPGHRVREQARALIRGAVAGDELQSVDVPLVEPPEREAAVTDQSQDIEEGSGP